VNESVSTLDLVGVVGTNLIEPTKEHDCCCSELSMR